MKANAVNDHKVPALDGLRGFAALYVVVFHQLQAVQFGNYLFDHLIRFGHQSVLLFFMISGFLIFGSIQRRTLTGSNWRQRFYLSRAFRILPLWWALLVLHQLVIGMSWRVFLANMMMVFGFVSFDVTYLPIVVAWSLFAEECFYVIAPFLQRFFSDSRDLLILVLLSVIVAALWTGLAPRLGVPDTNVFIWRFPLAQLSYFSIGLLLAWFSKTVSFGNWISQGSTQSWALDGLAVVAFFSPAFGIYIPAEIGCGLILVAVLAGTTVIGGCMRRRWLCYLGRRCYSIYISQLFVEMWLIPLRTRFGFLFSLNQDQLRIWWFPIYLCILIAFAEFTWRAWELPWQQWGEKWIVRSQVLDQGVIRSRGEVV